MLPRIAAGEPIDDMQPGLSVRLRAVFYDNGSLATTGRDYFDALGDDDKIRFLEALRLRREVFRQRAEAGTGTLYTTPLAARLYDSAFREIEPVLDRYALNDKMNDLAVEAPSLKRYMTQTGPRPGSGEAWVESLSDDRQTRVRDAVADRNAIRNIGGARLVAASQILANPAIDVSSAAAGIGRTGQDLMRLFTDSGPTERCRQLMLRMPPNRVATIEHNFQLRNSRHAAMSSPAFSLSIPATPSSVADSDLAAWQRRLMGESGPSSPAQQSLTESPFVMPQTPSGGWQWDLNTDTDAGPSNWQDEAASATPPYSREFSLSIPATPASVADSDLNLAAWQAQLTGVPSQGTPAVAMGYPAYDSPAPESSFAMPATPSGGWQWDLNAEASPHGQDDAQSAPAAHSPAFSLSVPATPSENRDADLNLAEWHAQLRARDPFVALLPSIGTGIPIGQINDGQSTWLRHFISEDGILLPQGREYVNRLSNDDQGRVFDALRLRQQAHQQRATTAAAEPAPSLSQRYQNAFSEIEPVLDQYALNGKLTSLAEEAPSIRRYLTKTGLHPRHGEAWLSHLSDDAQARVRDAIADRTAIHNLRQHLVQISELLANPANDLPRVAASIGADLHDLLRLFNDSGLTERGARYLSRRHPEQHAQVLQNLQLRHIARNAMPAPTPESSFVMPATPSGGWQWDLNAEGSPHGQDDAQSVPPVHSPAFSLSVPPTPSESADLNLAEWRAHLMGDRADPSGAGPSDATARAATASTQSLSQGDESAFSEIAPVLDHYALNGKVTDLVQLAPSIRRYLTKKGLHPRHGEAWLAHLSEDAQARVRDAIADRAAIQNLREHLVQISELLANPSNDLRQVAASIGVDLHDLLRLFNDSGLTERGAQYLSRRRPEHHAQILQNLQLRNSHEALMSIVGDLGRVPIAELQQRINVPLDEYFPRDEGITEKGFRFLKTLSKPDQTRLQLSLPIPHDVMTYHEINALIDRYEIGVASAQLSRDMPALRHFLTEAGGLGRNGGTGWFQQLPPDRQARIARAIENRQIINTIGPRFAQISSTFSNTANDMHRVARTGGVTAEQLARFLTEDGLTALGQRFLETLDNRTRQLVEANLALRRG